MFNLDINFLNDRPDLKPGSAAAARGGGRAISAGASESPVPLYAGAAALLALLGITGGAFLYFNWQKGNLEAEQVKLDAQLGTIEAKRKELVAANAKVTAAEGEIKALATVFNQIKPWSAMSQDLRERLPPGVQIASIIQSAPAGSAAAGGNPVYTPDVTIKGEANDFDQVNDLLVILKKSNFLKPEETRIIETARLDAKAIPPVSLPKAVELPVKPGQEKKENNNNQLIKLPGKVTFTVQSKLSDIPTSELLRELDRKGAVGLVTRVEALKSKGVKP
jgi:type IV pilus assembly protein PilN